jgi:hypothetical protein
MIIEEAHKEWRKAQQEERAAQEKIAHTKNNLLRVLAESLGISFHHYIEIGVWDCPSSPINRCVYNRQTDPYCLHCVYCSGSDER